MTYLLSLALLCCLVTSNFFAARAQQQQQPQDQAANYPYYMQSPIMSTLLEPSELLPVRQSENLLQQTEQRSMGPKPMRIISGARKMSLDQIVEQLPPPSDIIPAKFVDEQIPKIDEKIFKVDAQSCLYNKSYFSKLDECLARKPYPTIGLSAFKNEDLLIKRGVSEKRGCIFVLSNGLFKNYQISKYALDSESQCLDGNKVQISMDFTNVTLSYLWTLRCLNSADQMLEDATQGGQTSAQVDAEAQGICVGSSQNFGFASLQLSGIQAEVELATDIYKNWRVTNTTVSMHNPSSSAAKSSLHDHNDAETSLPGTNIRDYVFESLDGDELNWRYLQLFQNWTRNRMHSNFLDQYRRFLWISLQRCLSESADKLPVKLADVFANQKYN